MSDVQYQSLYRRYRPQKFAEVLGQDHVILALRNAVRDQKVAHAYLFSGPRGTGKTSAARILAKALNCENPTDGEPDGTCESCISIQQGSSLDVHELDAASNNGVEAMRDLVSKTALGTPGRWKVYIVDEVHMLSTAASNALLKTLEEPPSHVIFVLATTDPQKVLPTIRSRTQHFEFRLLSPELLTQLVSNINGQANLQVPAEALDLVVRRGKGSARDALSVLDQVAAAGVVDDENEVIDEIAESLCERDTGRALVAIAQAVNHGRDPQRLTIDLIEYLRNGFLALMSKSLVPLPDNAVAKVEAQARRLGAPALVRALEQLGVALQEMRDSPEQRVTLEVAIVRLTKPELSVDPAALLERIEKLESGTGPSGPAPRGTAQPSRPVIEKPQSSSAPAPKAETASSGQPQQRPALGGLRKAQNSEPKASPSAPAPQAPKPPVAQIAEPAVASTGEIPTRDRLTEVWGDVLLEKLPQRAKARFRTGRFVAVEDGRAIFALPNPIHRDRCEEVRNEVEQTLRDHFGVRIPLKLIIEQEPVAESSTEVEEVEVIDLEDTTPDQSSVATTPADRLLQAFPGSQQMQA